MLPHGKVKRQRERERERERERDQVREKETGRLKTEKDERGKKGGRVQRS